MDENEMSVFGVPEAEEELYRHFLRNPGTRADGLHLLLGSRPRATRAGIARLQELGLLHAEDTERRIFPADPEVALARLVDVRLHALHQELQRVTRSRHVIDGLRAEQGAGTPPPQGIEQLEGLAQIRDRIDDLAFFARDEILSVEPYTRLSAENIARSRPLDLRCLRRGVRIRNVVSSTALQDPPTADYLRELAEHGAAIRVTADTTERLLVYDRRTALVPLDPRDTSRGALLAHRSGLVSNIISLFERIWDQADDLAGAGGPAGGGGEPAAPAPSGIERRVLVSMCTAGKDEAGARELGVSVRTYRRHVADLMQTLGAASRAQAALLARERGWI
ncbi:helix-turn-helix transcriptional regulator [Streptomyces sp. CB04723]|uniref:helix-turn-helix transcriptional regulator n=1 Tax=Streptomyces TaxID=1883 RepID=UPI0015C41CA3|nr:MULTISPECIES: helix-turn-helix transcriptional regulator [unclassified Streptomyces]MBK0376561.1 helix-turn-helix transcriptional regulator [Streptomyces sp. RB110-1]MBK0387065.1 helix-turn-helix transcriptional regulator [Streptomyces sp. RB110-2]QLG34095.1 helix-turn-helix transcriptional regulator [Streptomyces sp. CB04723]